MSSGAAVSSSPAAAETAAATFAPVSDQTLLRLATIGIWCLPILTFTTPGRPSPSSLAFLDGLAVVKLVVLLIVFFGGGLALLTRLQQRSTRRTFKPLIPFLLFFGWAVTSVLWTPLRAVTMGQAGGLGSLLVLACLVSLVSQDAEGLESILKTLSKSLFAFSLFVVLVNYLAPNFSGLDRRMLVHGSDGVVHPTAAGANASLGLLLAALCFFVKRYRWATRIGLAAFVVHGLILYYASSRAALGMAVLTVPVIAMLYVDNAKRAFALLGLGILAVAMVISDPGFSLLFDDDSAGVQYITRGQSADQLKGVSGRSEMWSKIWNEAKKSPLIGHGYFVTSEAGKIEVWYMKANHTAHNIYLQVLASTGAIGLSLFVVALASLAYRLLGLGQFDRQAREVLVMLAFIGFWYLGWSLLCASFMGPVRSESMLFFTMLGIGLGQLARIGKATAPSISPPQPAVAVAT